MRALWPALALLALAPLAAGEHEEAYAILHDWEEGTSLAGTPLVASPLAHALRFPVDACHPGILLDLLYEPDHAAVGADGVGQVELQYRYGVELWHNGTKVATTRIDAQGYGRPIGRLPAEGDVEVRFWPKDGADIEWAARVRGLLANDDLACQHPL